MIEYSFRTVVPAITNCSSGVRLSITLQYSIPAWVRGPEGYVGLGGLRVHWVRGLGVHWVRGPGPEGYIGLGGLRGTLG